MVSGHYGAAAPSPVGAACDSHTPVGVGVLDDPVRRIVALARCVEDAAPYGGIGPRSASPVGVDDHIDPDGAMIGGRCGEWAALGCPAALLPVFFRLFFRLFFRFSSGSSSGFLPAL